MIEMTLSSRHRIRNSSPGRQAVLTTTLWPSPRPMYNMPHVYVMLNNVVSGHNIFYIAFVQSQKVVSAYFTSKQILPFGFAEQITTYLCYNVTVCAANLSYNAAIYITL